MDVGLKDSGIEWIGKMPDNWNISRVFNEYEVVLGKMLTSEPETEDSTEEKYVCSANVKRVGIAGPLKLMWFTPKEKESLLLKKGDLIVAEGGDSGNSAIYDGSLDPCYIQNAVHRIRSFDKTDVSNKFLFYWMCFAKDIGYIDNICNKATISHFTKNKVQMMPIVDVDYCIKKSIVHYLDTKCSRIDRLCAITKEKIQKLKELKQSIITEVVWGKLDSSEYSINNWLNYTDQITKGWRVVKLRQICNHITDGSHFSPKSLDQGQNFVTISNIDNGQIDLIGCPKISNDDYNELVKNGCQPKIGDVLLTKDGTVGETALVEAGDFVVLSSIAILTPNPDCIRSKYLRYWLMSEQSKQQMESAMAGSALRRITLSKIVDFWIAVPSTVIQDKIIEYLDDKLPLIDTEISLTEQAVEKLTEYKQSIIYEYVTGKKRVPQEV